MDWFIKKIYLKDSSTQTEEQEQKIYLCFEYRTYIYDYGGNTDERSIYIPILDSIFETLEDAKRWTSFPNPEGYKRIIRIYTPSKSWYIPPDIYDYEGDNVVEILKDVQSYENDE